MKHRHSRRLFWSLFMLGIAIGNVSAENVTPLTPEYENASLSIEDAAFQILTKSPGFKADIFSFKSLESDLKTASNLPDPEIGGEYLVMPKDVENRWAAQIEWGLEWPGVYSAKGKEAKSKMIAADKAIYEQRINKITEIKDLLLDYILCRQKLNLLNELDRNNKQIYELSEAHLNSGQMTLLDLNKVKIEYSNIKGAIAAVEVEEADLISTISDIYGEDCREILKSVTCKFPEIYLPSEIDMAQIRKNAPAVQSAMAETQTAREGKKVSRMEALPSISVGYKHQYEDKMHFNGAILGISIPIFSSRGKQKAADAQILEAEYKMETTASSVELDVKSLMTRLKLMQQQIAEIRPLVENIDYNTILIKYYEEGLISLLDYITERNYFTNAAIEFVGLRHAASKTQNELNKYLLTYNF